MSYINLFSPIDSLYYPFTRIVSPHDDIAVGIRCDEEEGFYTYDGLDKVAVSPEQAADMVRESVFWEEGSTIRLFADASGIWGTSSPAQQLANALGTMVVAPAGHLYIWEDGTCVASQHDDIASPDDPRLDYSDQERFWFPFSPQVPLG